MMTQLLIVDDEIHAIRGIQCSIDWEKLGITNIFTATEIQKAKDVISNHTVDIMLCDIEMPQGSGLELLAWIRERYKRTECIFLTCHADFNYARKAIELSAMDYLLKPIMPDELEKSIAKAIKKIELDNKNEEYRRSGELWVRNLPVLVERFWLDILNETIPSTKESIHKAASTQNIPLTEGQKFIAIMIKIRGWNEEMSPRDERLMEFALKNSAQELIFKNEEEHPIIELENGTLIGVLYLSDSKKFSINELIMDCENYIEICHRYFCCDLCCYIGDEVYDYEMMQMVKKLFEIDKNNVAFTNKVFLTSGCIGDSDTVQMPDMDIWSVMLVQGLKDEVLEEALGFLNEAAGSGKLNARLLYQFQQDFLQMIHTVLKQKDVQTHKILGDSETEKLYSRSSRSVKDLGLWMKHVLEKFMDYVYELEKTQSAVDRAKKYITQHLNEQVTREDVAAHVYLNPDYLTRIFKKETGMFISEYLFQERLKIAKELLKKTDMPVSAVAKHVGFTNFSYFSQIFKKFNHMNPIDFRQKYSR